MKTFSHLEPITPALEGAQGVENAHKQPTLFQSHSLIEIVVTRSHKTFKHALNPDFVLPSRGLHGAIPELTKIYASTNDNEAGLGLGYCHLQVKNYDSAIAIFEKTRTKKSDVSDSAAWYIAHRYLSKGDLQSTKSILQKNIRSKTVTL